MPGTTTSLPRFREAGSGAGASTLSTRSALWRVAGSPAETPMGGFCGWDDVGGAGGDGAGTA